MKKLIIILCTITVLFPTNTWGQLKFGVEAGINLTHFKHDSSTGNYEAYKTGNMQAGFQLGGTISYETSKHWMWMSGLSFSQTQSNMNLRMNRFPDIHIRLNHLTIPLKVGYNIHIGEQFELSPYIGAYGSYNFSIGKSPLTIQYWDGNTLMHQHREWNPMEGYYFEIPTTEESTPPNILFPVTLEAFRHWTYGAMGGLKMVIKKHYSIDLSYSESIKKIADHG